MNRVKGTKDMTRLCEIFSKTGLNQKKNMRKKLSSLNIKDHHSLCTLIFNIVTNFEFLGFSKIQKKKILKIMLSNQTFFEGLSKKKTGARKQKQAIMTQTGGGLIISLLSVAIPALVSLLAR